MKGQEKKIHFYKRNSGEVLSKLKSRGFRATSLSTYDFSTLYTTLPHNLIKEKLLDLIERIFKKKFKNEGTLYLAYNDKKAFSHFYRPQRPVRTYAMLSSIFWTIVTLDFVLSHTEKLLLIRWVQIVLLW